jgi:transcriptional regulator with XRE-family HTH domain
LTAFGSVLRQLRDARALSTGQVEKRLQAGGTRLGRSTISQYEQGAVWAPDPVVLAELARLYRTDVEGLIATLKANRQDPSLTTEQADAIRRGASRVNTVAVGVLESERDEAREALRQMRELASQIVAVAATAADRESVRAESGMPLDAESIRRKNYRAARG